jgi:8-oxo-dGTP diphosphatase
VSEGLQFVGKTFAEMQAMHPSASGADPQVYVCGFMFSADRSEVVLIRKAKPAWQIGKLNGVGGKVEPGEQPLSAMKREFAEETGLNHMPWEHFATLRGDGFVVYFYETTADYHHEAQTMETEEVVIGRVDDFLADPALMPNLRVLIPLALDTSGIVKPVTLTDAVRQ